MSQSMRMSGSLLARMSSRSLQTIPRRAFTVSSASRMPDLIQEMYLKELRAYKATPPNPAEAEQATKKFQLPAAPKSPEEANLASDMKAYEDQVVEIEGQAATGETQKAEDDYFEDLKQFDDSHEGQPAH